MSQERLKEWLLYGANGKPVKVSGSQFSVLVDFASWLDRAAEQPRAAVETLICPLCDGKEYFDKEGARDTCPLCGGAGQIKNPSHR